MLTTAQHLAYATTLSLYIHANSEADAFPLLRVLSGPECSISSFSLNAEIVVAVTPADRKVYMWSAQTGEAYENLPVKQLIGELLPIVVAAHPTQNNRVAFGCDKGRVIVWDVKDGKSFTVQVTDASDSIITCCQWSVEAPHLLAVGTDNGIVAIVDSAAGRVSCQLDCFDSLRSTKESFFERLVNDSPRVSCLSFDPKSQNYLLVGSAKGFLVLVDINAAVSSSSVKTSVVQTFEPSATPFSSVAFIPQQPGCFVTADGATSALQLWNVSVRQSLKSLRPKAEVAVKAASILATTSDSTATQKGCIAFLAFKDGSVALYNLDVNRLGPVDTTAGHCETVFDCRFAAHNPDLISSCSYDGTIRIWDTKPLGLQTSITARKPVYSVDWSPNGEMIAAGMLSGEVAVFSTSTGKEVWRKTVCDDVAWKLSWSKAEPGVLAVASRDGNATVVAAHDGATLRTYRHASPVYGIDFDPIYGKLLAVGGYDGKGRIYFLEHQRLWPVATLVGHSAEISQMVFNPLVPNIIATTSNDFTVRVWRIADSVWNLCTNPAGIDAIGDWVYLQPLLTLTGHTNKTRGLVWNPLCPYLLISGSWDATIRMWDTRSGAGVHTARAHAADVYSLSIHPQRPTILVSASRDTTVRFWYLQHLAPLHLDAAFGVLRESVVPVSSIQIGQPLTEEQAAKAGLPCCGPAVERLLQQLDSERAPHQRLRRITEFFDFPNGAADVVSCASFRSSRDLSTIDTGATVAPTDHIANVAITTANAKLDALKKQKSSAVGSSKRERELREIAAEYLRLGNTKQYCELMIEASQYDRAIAAAPAAGFDYWKALCLQVADTLLSSGESERAVELLILCGESHRAADVLAANGNLSAAVVIVQACAQALPASQPSCATPFVAVTDARFAANKIASFAKTNASKYQSTGNPMLATASLIAADDIERGVEAVLRSACIPIGHLLFHTLPVSQELLDYGFSQSLLMAASSRRWRTVALALERLSSCMRLAAAADALAMVAAEPNFSQAYRYDVEKVLEPHFQGANHKCPTTATFGVSLWNVVIQGDLATQTRHNDAILKKCSEDIRAIVAIVIASAASGASEPPSQAIAALQSCRRWLHYTVHTEATPVASKQLTLFYAFFTAALLARLVFRSEYLAESASKLATMFSEVDPRGNAALLEQLYALHRSTVWPMRRLGVEQERCLPQGAKLPCHLSTPRMWADNPISSGAPRGPLYALEDGTLCTFQEALEWHRCSWFSPRATGRRILPF